MATDGLTLARERTERWYGHMVEVRTVLGAAGQWAELVDVLKGRGWHDVTPVLVAAAVGDPPLRQAVAQLR